MSIFDATNNRKNPIRVNKFDWSHANNFTTEIGRITPIFCELVPAHSSVRVKPTIGLQFMPMVFPIQTRMKMRVSFFRYPLRALWKDYRDYVGNFRQGLVEPYHDFKGQIPKTGSLYDYLGLPTTLAGGYGTDAITSFTGKDFQYISSEPLFSLDTEYTVQPAIKKVSGIQQNYYLSLIDFPIGNEENKYISVDVSSFRNVSVIINIIGVSSSGDRKFITKESYNGSLPPLNVISFERNPELAYYFVIRPKDNIVSSDVQVPTSVWFPNSGDYTVNCYRYGKTTLDVDDDTSPYYDSSSDNKDKQLKISAYAARAYEGIYNSYFRDDRNNPFYVNGEIQYNQWLPTMEGGADTTLYSLRYCNWEKDFLTTAVQSPQQGVAPLVGITTYEETTLNSDGSQTTKQRVALVDEDGRKFGLDFDSDADGLNDVRYTELEVGQVVQQPRSLINLAQSGISINDLRNVNAYQKYLELNMRAGYSYKDIIEQRFNVKVRYSDLLMPEFIGGFSEPIEMHSITQTVETNDSGTYSGALGSQAGVAGCRRSGSPISVFCDEESIIIGLCVVTPIPVYTQLLPKHFLYRELLDHYQPEFNNIGFQPITYQEVCPVQAYNSNPDELSDTFGYQRPWYEYVQKYDVAHGLYRTQLRNFLMNRTFNLKPQLSESFLLVDPEQVNDVFSVTETTDKIYGQIWFDCTAKLPISRVAIPKLD